VLVTNLEVPMTSLGVLGSTVEHSGKATSLLGQLLVHLNVIATTLLFNSFSKLIYSACILINVSL
jgi:hypothetical protein